jgi:hypothetical protein
MDESAHVSSNGIGAPDGSNVGLRVVATKKVDTRGRLTDHPPFLVRLITDRTFFTHHRFTSVKELA